MKGWISLGRFGYTLLDDTKNALKDAPMEYKFLLSNTLAAMWCVTFGVYTAELLFIGGTTSLGIHYYSYACFSPGSFSVLRRKRAKIGQQIWSVGILSGKASERVRYWNCLDVRSDRRIDCLLGCR